jgi:hypothetical protein
VAGDAEAGNRQAHKAGRQRYEAGGSERASCGPVPDHELGRVRPARELEVDRRRVLRRGGRGDPLLLNEASVRRRSEKRGRRRAIRRGRGVDGGGDVGLRPRRVREVARPCDQVRSALVEREDLPAVRLPENDVRVAGRIEEPGAVRTPSRPTARRSTHRAAVPSTPSRLALALRHPAFGADLRQAVRRGQSRELRLERHPQSVSRVVELRREGHRHRGADRLLHLRGRERGNVLLPRPRRELLRTGSLGHCLDPDESTSRRRGACW